MRGLICFLRTMLFGRARADVCGTLVVPECVMQLCLFVVIHSFITLIYGDCSSFNAFLLTLFLSLCWSQRVSDILLCRLSGIWAVAVCTLLAFLLTVVAHVSLSLSCQNFKKYVLCLLLFVFKRYVITYNLFFMLIIVSPVSGDYFPGRHRIQFPNGQLVE